MLESAGDLLEPGTRIFLSVTAEDREGSLRLTAERVKTLGGMGLDVVSSGGLIHQARWADLSLKLH